MEHTITLTPSQEKAIDKQVKAVNDSHQAQQIAAMRHQDAVNSLRNFVEFVADGKDFDFEKTEVKDGMLILRKEEPEVPKPETITKPGKNHTEVTSG
jgi:hypothetical protein